jgi:hypothetical protein
MNALETTVTYISSLLVRCFPHKCNEDNSEFCFNCTRLPGSSWLRHFPILFSLQPASIFSLGRVGYPKTTSVVCLCL